MIYVDPHETPEGVRCWYVGMEPRQPDGSEKGMHLSGREAVDLFSKLAEKLAETIDEIE